MKRLLPLLLLLATTASASDLDLLRAQFIGFHTAAGADRDSPRMRDALNALESTARAQAEALRSDGSWPDIHYDELPSGTWGPWAHTQRLWILAKAYQTPGLTLYHDPRLLADITAALTYTKTFYGASILPLGNWWFWTIGIPIDLGPTLVLMNGEIDPTLSRDLVTAMQVRIGNSPTARGISGPVPTGENLVWSSFTHLCLGLLKDDPAMLAAVREAMATVVRPTAGDGIQSDHSFHQHGAQLYTGGYGGAFASDVARYALIARNTTYGLPANALASFSDYVADGIAWSLYGEHFDVSVVGREVARPSTTGYNGMAALVQSAQFPSPRSPEIRAAAAKALQTWPWTMVTELACAATQVETARTPAEWPSGHRHYPDSDYTIHRRDGWFASIKMFSTRTKSGESTNGENLLGSRQSDGRMHLVLTGGEYFGRDVWPALDWTRLPGITVEQNGHAADATYGFGTRPFAGGTGDGENGVSAMELAPLQSTLTAKKAWFFFDDCIAFLTNSVRSTARAETIVNQWPLLNASSPLTRRDDWAHLEGIGYWFPTPADLRTSRETRSGSWAALGGSTDTTPHAMPFVTLWLDHTNSTTAEYVLVPNVTAAAIANWAASRPLAILANNENVSAVRDLRNGDLGITFWRAASIEGIQSNSAAVVYLTGNTQTLKLSAADPNANATGTFTLTLPGAWSTTAVPTTRTTRTTTLTFSRNSGRTTSVTLTKMQGKTRALRR
ncbi:MAG: polysaccharide lyase family 8 super-sandwich domain-containing protein [Acidobacteriota bacterium]